MHVRYFDGKPVRPRSTRELALANLENFHYLAEEDYDSESPVCPISELHMQNERTVLHPQSGNASQSIMSMGDAEYQNVKFSDQTTDHAVDVGGTIDATRKFQDSDDATLQNFFSRPIKITTVDWTTTTTAYGRFNPWALYFNNPRVKNRIANYNLLRCKLRLKFLINGNSFLYGRAMASYHPLYDFDQVTNISSTEPANITSLSQMPKIFLNPTTSTGGEMTLPFFWHLNYLNIPNEDWETMGQVIIRIINELKHANNAIDQTTISVFAWAEDVHLSVLTSVDPATLSPQSGEIDEANREGVVSGPATRIANVANALSTIPSIAPYAIATSKMASMTASMAKMLGYSRPPVTADPTPYKPSFVSSLATTTVPDGAAKLTVDDKQELTIDPTISGINSADPLDILSIAQRESFLTKFEWQTGLNPEVLLWNTRIDPCAWADATLSSALYLPATAMAALPFKYWTGTLNYRFQVVCSSFHRGRLKVVYDPNFISTNEYNTNYVEIIDISDKSDFTISIANGQELTYLEHQVPGQDSVTNMYSTTAFTSKSEGNGVLAVYIVNELTVPNDVANNDIEVNVYISAGDDFQVAVPSDEYMRYVLKPQSGDLQEILLPQSGDEVLEDEMDAPFQEQSSDLGPTYDPLTNVTSVFFGETIKSFRTMLKRYVLHEVLGLTETGYKILAGTRCIYPFYRGNVFNAVHFRNAATTNDPYNYCGTVMFHWIAMAHSGIRGGMRYKIVPRGDRDVDAPSIIQVERNTFLTEALYYLGIFNADVYVTVSRAARAAVIGFNKRIGPYTRQTLPGPLGSHRITSDINPASEFEVPFYSNQRFIPGKHIDLTSIVLPDAGITTPGWRFQIFHKGTTNSTYDIYTAAAEDFTPLFFTGLPPIYYEQNPPSA